MSKEPKPQKEKAEKKYTRAQAERALSRGVDPQKFTKHSNYHVRAKAWTKMGKPLPDDSGEAEKFLASIHVKQPAPAPTDDLVAETLEEKL